jgi:hypothetical protein
MIPNKTSLMTTKGELKPHCFLPSINDSSEIGSLIKPYLPVTTSGAVFDWGSASEQIGDLRVPFAFDIPWFSSSEFKIKKQFDRGVWVSSKKGKHRDYQTIGPYQALERAEREADFCFTFDFRIPFDARETEKRNRFELSILNAVWMIENSRRFHRGDFPIIAICPGWNSQTFVEAARRLENYPFSALAIRYQPDISARFSCFYWCEMLAEIKKITTRPLFLLDAKADLAQFALDQNLIYGATGNEGVLSFTKDGVQQPGCSIPHALLQLAGLNKKAMPLSAYRLLHL